MPMIPSRKSPSAKPRSQAEADTAFSQAFVTAASELAGGMPKRSTWSITDWDALWRELSERRFDRTHKQADQPQSDEWANRAHEFQAKVCRRWEKPDSSRDFLLTQIDGDTTVLDIGSGPGAWSLLASKTAKRVTALDPSPSMLAILKHIITEQGIDNIDTVQAAWPGAKVAQHDLSFCSHAMYMTPHLPAFIQAMNAVTRRRCFFLMRAPVLDGPMAIASQRVWGHPHDSNNFIIAYNILIEMGIYANVLMEDTGDWGAWKNASLDEALFELKRKLGIAGPSEHDDYLLGLLRKRLTQDDGVYVWPPSMRSALVYWHVND